MCLSDFPRLADEWRSHCHRVAVSSNMNDRLTHPAFRQLVELGPDAVPLMMELFQADDLPPWEFALQEVTGQRFVPDADEFDPQEVRLRVLGWWAKRIAPATRP